VITGLTEFQEAVRRLAAEHAILTMHGAGTDRPRLPYECDECGFIEKFLDLSVRTIPLPDRRWKR